MTVSWSQWLIWLCTVLCQVCLSLLARRRDWWLSVYLGVLSASSLVGVLAVHFGPNAYFLAYCGAGLVDDCLTSLLLLKWLDELRKCARLRRSGVVWPAALILVAALSAIALTPKYDIHGAFNLWVVSNLVSHAIWLWLAIVLALVPAYCIFTMAVPELPLLLKLIGLMLYIGVHAGFVDSLLQQLPSRIALKAVNDTIYLVVLSLWFVAIRTRSAPCSSHSPVENRT